MAQAKSCLLYFAPIVRGMDGSDARRLRDITQTDEAQLLKGICYRLERGPVAITLEDAPACPTFGAHIRIVGRDPETGDRAQFAGLYWLVGFTFNDISAARELLIKTRWTPPAFNPTGAAA